MQIKEVRGRVIKDSRGDKTIEVSVKTGQGLFSASSPSGKSKGKNEKKPYILSVEEDISRLQDFSDDLSKLSVKDFLELNKVEKIVRGKVGANTLYALETAILKALASDSKMSLWQIINDKAEKLPLPVGNCIGGGLHSKEIKGKRPDFQEFLFIPRGKNFSENVFLMKQAHKMLGEELKVRKAQGEKNDENAWSTSLSNEEVLEIMMKVKNEIENQAGKDVDIGLDVAASSFFNGLLYEYKNPKKRIQKKEQINYSKDYAMN